VNRELELEELLLDGAGGYPVDGSGVAGVGDGIDGGYVNGKLELEELLLDGGGSNKLIGIDCAPGYPIGIAFGGNGMENVPGGGCVALYCVLNVSNLLFQSDGIGCSASK
jgi:hypothetical protein